MKVLNTTEMYNQRLKWSILQHVYFATKNHFLFTKNKKANLETSEPN